MTAVVNVMTDPWIAIESRGEQKVEKKLPRVLACVYRHGDRHVWFVANVDETPVAVDLGEIVAHGEPNARPRTASLNGAKLLAPPDLGEPHRLPALSVLMLAW